MALFKGVCSSVKYATLTRETVALLLSQTWEIRSVEQYEYKTGFNLNERLKKQAFVQNIS